MMFGFVFSLSSCSLPKIQNYGDDEFSAGGSILLDTSATDLLGFETLAILVTILFRKLTEKDF